MKKAAILLPIVVFVFSCKKDHAPQPQTSNPGNTLAVSDYSKLDSGNYWVYQVVSVDTNNNVTVTGTDSVSVTHDTIINGNTYAVLQGTWYTIPKTWIMRDSAGFIVDQTGKKLFTVTDFNTTLFIDSVPSLFQSVSMVPSAQQQVTVPAGTYTCYDLLGTVTADSSSYQWAHVRYNHSYRASGIGLVEDVNYYYSSPNYIERRLMRYHVQ